MPVLRRTGALGMSEEARAKRRSSIGGSDARIIMSGDQDEIEHLWRQKRGEIPPDDLTDMLLAQMGVVMEPLVLDWFEYRTGMVISGEQTRAAHSQIPWATCTLDGLAANDGEEPHAIFEAKVMSPFRWSLDQACEKYAAQLHWNMFVTGYDKAYLAVVTGGAQFAQVDVEADRLYQAQVLEVCQDFWSCVESGKVPGNPVIPPPPVEAIRVVDMTASNSWAAEAATMLETTDHCDRYEAAKKAIKLAMPADAKEARGHGVTLKRAVNGRISIVLDETALAEARERQRLLSAVA